MKRTYLLILIYLSHSPLYYCVLFIRRGMLYLDNTMVFPELIGRTFMANSEFMLYVAYIFVDCFVEKNHRKMLLRVHSNIFTTKCRGSVYFFKMLS